MRLLLVNIPERGRRRIVVDIVVELNASIAVNSLKASVGHGTDERCPSDDSPEPQPSAISLCRDALETRLTWVEATVSSTSLSCAFRDMQVPHRLTKEALPGAGPRT